MLCHDRVYVIRRHGKGDTGETNLNCQKSMGRKPSLSKIRILRFLWRNVSVKNHNPCKIKILRFLRRNVAHLPPKSCTYHDFLRYIFFAEHVAAITRLLFDSCEVYLFSTVYFHSTDHKPHNWNISGTTSFQVDTAPQASCRPYWILEWSMDGWKICIEKKIMPNSEKKTQKYY